MTLLATLLKGKLSRTFYGWRIVASSFVINAFHDGTYFLGSSIFFLPIGRDLNLSRTATSIPFTANKILPALLGPFVGMLIDRYGPARILVASVFLSGLGWVLLSRTNSFAYFVIVLVSVLSIGMMGWVSSTTTAINVWFRRRRSTAMAITFTGFTTGGAIIPPSLALGVSHLGWRTTMLATGLTVWSVVLPLATRIRRSPESMGLEPDGQTRDEVQESVPGSHREVPEYEATVREALTSSAFWMLALATGLLGMVDSAFTLHTVAIMTSKGLGETTAGFLVGLLSILMVPLVLIMGWLGDRWPKQRISAVGHFVRLFAFLLMFLWQDISVSQMVLILVLLSPTKGIWSLGFTLVADLFGRGNVATLRGFMSTSTSVLTVGMTLMAGLLLWFLPEPRARQGGATPATSEADG